MEQFLSTDRTRRLLIALAFAMFCAIALSFWIGAPSNSALISGDFPAFYSAGKIISEGRGQDLYNFDLQRQIQNQNTPSRDGFLAFAYPPWFALFFAPLSLLPFATAKLLWSLLLAGVSALSARVLIGRWTVESVLAVLLLPPLLHADVAGQNTALSLLCLIAVQKLLEERPNKILLLGVVSALFCFKPHFGLVSTLWCLTMLKERRAQFLVVWLAAAGALFAVSSAISGTNWLGNYIEGVNYFSQLDLVVNYNQLISLPALLPAAQLFFSAILTLLMLLGALRSSRPALFLGPALVLCSPHALYYDSALILPLAAALPQKKMLYVTAFLLSFVTIVHKDRLGAEAITIFSLWLFFLSAKQERYGCFK